MDFSEELKKTTQDALKRKQEEKEAKLREEAEQKQKLIDDTKKAVLANWQYYIDTIKKAAENGYDRKSFQIPGPDEVSYDVYAFLKEEFKSLGLKSQFVSREVNMGDFNAPYYFTEYTILVTW